VSRVLEEKVAVADPVTIPQLFRKRVAAEGSRVARRFKKGGVWMDMTWAEFGKAVEDVARGCMAIGVKSGNRVALLSNSRAEWVEIDFGIMSAGAVSIPIYPSSTPDQIEYIVNNSEAMAIFAENEEQLAKVLAIRDKIARVVRVVLIEGKPPASAPQASDGKPLVVSLEELKKAGWEVSPEEVRKAVEGVSWDEIATIVYTSGTTGPPKGVVQTHRNHVSMVRNLNTLGDVTRDDMDLLFLPLAHSFARAEEMAQIEIGNTTAYAESIDKLGVNLQEVHPTLLFSVPRIYEKVYAKIQADAAASPVKKAIVGWAMKVGREVSRLKQKNQPIPFFLGFKYAFATKLVFSKVQEKLGGRLKFAVSGGAPLAREIAEFFHACGVTILEGYGLTETCPALTINTQKAYKFGFVGKPIPNVEVKIAEDGEILGRGDNIAKGYYKRDDETAAVFLKDGWFATGDIGNFDEDGFLKITDRKKDLIKTSGGKYIAPQEIENKLKSDPFIAQAMIHADRRKFVSVVVTLNSDAVRAWAKGLEVDGAEALAKHPKVRDLIEERIEGVNKTLASYESIKKFIIAPREWTPESGELTPTLKVKRKVVTQIFQKELDALYDEKYE
jgi:long-chain acyl-CoA synthetase